MTWADITNIHSLGTHRVDGTIFTKNMPAPGTSQIYVTDRLDAGDYARIVTCQAVVCEESLATSHMNIVCRILGIPVAEVPGARKRLFPGNRAWVDPLERRVYLSEPPDPAIVPSPGNSELDSASVLSLGQQVSIVDDPLLIDRVNAYQEHTSIERFFLRSELLWLATGIHPYTYLARQGAAKTIEFLIERLGALSARLMQGQILNFRGLDLRSDEQPFPNTQQIVEPNPQLGLHGTRELIREGEYLSCELRAVNELRDNVSYSLPFVTDSSEVAQVRETASRIAPDVSLGMFIEIPANLFEIDAFMAQGIDAFYIGTKDLVQFLYAADRSNSSVGHLLNVYRSSTIRALSHLVQSIPENIPTYMFVMPEDAKLLSDSIAGLRRISMPASDLIRICQMAQA